MYKQLLKSKENTTRIWPKELLLRFPVDTSFSARFPLAVSFPAVNAYCRSPAHIACCKFPALTACFRFPRLPLDESFSHAYCLLQVSPACRLLQVSRHYRLLQISLCMHLKVCCICRTTQTLLHHLPVAFLVPSPPKMSIYTLVCRN